MIWHSAELQAVTTELKTNPERGLTSGEADDRISVYGANRLMSQKKKTFFERFLKQNTDFMVIILMIAAAISLLTNFFKEEKDWIEPIVIIAIVLINSIIGALQESKAEAALDALKSMIAPAAKVKRDGIVKVINASELVPGDIIVLEAGDYIPADARLLEVASLRSDESALTGESVPTEKMIDVNLEDITSLGDRLNMVYSGCSVSYGRGTAVVTETGMSTEMGKIATMLREAGEETTPLKKRLADMGKTLGIAALIICAIIFVIGIFQGPAPGQSFAGMILSLFMTAVSLAVAAIPEGLPAIVTVVLALGVQRMVKKNAIIRNLPAVETLGSASVICSDKTGTLTQNRMTMTMLFDGHALIDPTSTDLPESATMLLKLGTMCCDGRVSIENGKEVHVGDPTETGIVAACLKYCGLTKDDIENTYPRMDEVPFDSDRKLMTTINMINGKPFAVVKGAPDILMSRCNGGNIKAAEEAAKSMGESALRVLAVAIKPLDSVPSNPNPENMECDLTLIGLFGMIDPPRPEARDAVALCHNAGIRTIMITGDHITTAKAIAEKIGILREGEEAITGAQLDEMPDELFAERIESISVYARVTPEDKIRIVRTWQLKGHVVAMTGDGVNDAPALKASDIGCAMGITGTDVAKGAADMTLTDDNFATIVTAVKEGRGIYDNIKKAIHYLLSCNLGELLTVFFGMLLFKASPLLAIQLLWVNLVTDSAPALALGMEPVERDVMDRKPRAKNESIFSGGLGIDAIWQGVMFAVITLVAYGFGNHISGKDHAYANTMAFAVLAFSQIVHAFNARSRHSLFKAGFHTNKYMLLAGGFSVILMLLVLLTPLRVGFGLVQLQSTEWTEIVLLSLVPLVLTELVKLGTSLYGKFVSKKSE